MTFIKMIMMIMISAARSCTVGHTLVKIHVYPDDNDDHNNPSSPFLHSWTQCDENHLDHINEDNDHDDHIGDDYDLGGQEQAQAVCFSTRKVSQKVSTRPIS